MSSPAGAAASLARHLGVLADGLRTAAASVPDEVGFWSDPGGVLLLDMLGGAADRIRITARVCTTVAAAVAAHADDLARAEHLARTATPASPVVASQTTAAAQDLVRASGRRLLATLEPATRELPEPGHGADAVRAAVAGPAGSFLLGLLQAVTAPVAAVRWLAEYPGDRAAHTRQAGTAMTALADPKTWLGMLDLRTLRADPAQWAGEMAPAALGGFAAGSRAADRARLLYERQLPARLREADTRGREATHLRRTASGAASVANRRVLTEQAATLDEVLTGGRGWRGEQGRRLNAGQLRATDRMRDLSAAQAARLTDAMQEAADETGLELRGLEHNVKGVDSLRRKAADGFRRNRSRPMATTLGGLNDIVRFTLEAPTASNAAEVRRLTQLMEAKGFHLDKVWNAWTSEKHGYRGINSTWTQPDTGVQFEVQFHTPESLRATQVTHGAYERQRLLQEGTPEWDRLDAIIRREYARAPLPPGIAAIPPHGYLPPALPEGFTPPTDLRVPAAVGAGTGTAAAVVTATHPRRRE